MGGPELIVAENPKASSLCPFSYRLTFILFQNPFWFEQIPPWQEKVSWIHINLPLSSYVPSFPFWAISSFLPFFFLLYNLSPHTSYICFFLISSQLEAGPGVCRIDIRQVWELHLYLIYTLLTKSCKVRSFVYPNIWCISRV